MRCLISFMVLRRSAKYGKTKTQHISEDSQVNRPDDSEVLVFFGRNILGLLALTCQVKVIFLFLGTHEVKCQSLWE